jgi:hypothetical protein
MSWPFLDESAYRLSGERLENLRVMVVVEKVTHADTRQSEEIEALMTQNG